MVTMVSDEVGNATAAGRNIQPTFGYYRQPNGWITVSPVTDLERIKYEREGWKHLGKYGAFDMGLYGANNPFEGLFMFGGAHEMSAEQVIQTGLYMKPPLVPTCRQHITQFHRAHKPACWTGAKPVEFPQLANVPKERLGPFPCGFCDRNLPTKEALHQHQQVAHSKELGNLQTGRSLGTAVADVLNTLQVPVPAPAPAPAPADQTEYEALRHRVAQFEAQEAKRIKRNLKMQQRREHRRKLASATTSVA